MADETAAAEPAPSDEELKRERTAKKKADALKKARDAKAAKRASGSAASSSAEKPAGGAKAESAMLELAALAMVKLLWGISRGIAYLAGGSLEPLSDDEREQGAKEALQIVRRFGWLAFLAVFGLPLWLIDQVSAHWKPREAPAKKPASSDATAPRAAQP